MVACREATLTLPAAEGAQDSVSPVGPVLLKAQRKMRPRRERPRLGPVTVEVLSGVAATKPSGALLVQSIAHSVVKTVCMSQHAEVECLLIATMKQVCVC